MLKKKVTLDFSLTRVCCCATDGKACSAWLSKVQHMAPDQLVGISGVLCVTAGHSEVGHIHQTLWIKAHNTDLLCLRKKQLAGCGILRYGARK